MKTLYISLPQFFPVPAVRGGAVETLVEMFIMQNELIGNYNIVCFSTSDPEAEKQASNYKYTSFVFINNHRKLSKIKYHISRVFHRILGVRPYFLDDYHSGIYEYIVKHPIPYAMIAEGGSCIDEYRRIAEYVGNEKMYLHVHLNSTPPQKCATIFKNLIAVSNYTAKIWNKNGIFSNVSVLENAVDIDRYNKISQEDRLKLRKELGYTEADFIVLFCGRLTEVKGVRELIQAVNSIDNKDIKLLILGSSNFAGARITPYQQTIIDLTNGNTRIKFTGFIPNSEVHKYYSISSVVAIPSIYEDPAPLVLIEAMASSKPLIITNSGGMPEYTEKEGRILVNKENEDFVTELTHAIEQLYNDKEKISKMGKINLERSKHFSKENYYKRLCEIIR